MPFKQLWHYGIGHYLSQFRLMMRYLSKFRLVRYVESIRGFHFPVCCMHAERGLRIFACLLMLDAVRDLTELHREVLFNVAPYLLADFDRVARYSASAYLTGTVTAPICPHV
jgi:hypothetical protein